MNPDHATVGTRVWALFDHSGQKWWGGTVVGNETGKLDIVFDDGDRQMLPAREALGPTAEEAGAPLYACRHPRPLDADETRASKILRPIRHGWRW